VGPFVVILVSCALAAVAAEAATFDELAAQAAAARLDNRLPDAIELYRQAVQLNPSWAEGWWFVGALSHATRQFAGCAAGFDEFVRLDDKRPTAWSLLGLCEFETGAYDQAFDHLRRGIAGADLPPEVEADARFHYALLLSRAGFFDRARRELQRFARAGGDQPMLLAALGLNALRQPLLPDEVPAPRMDAVLKAGTAARFWILGEADKADAGFRELVARYPTLPGVHYLYATYLSDTSREEAAAEFRRELEVNPENADAGALLALLLIAAKDPSGALPFARKAATQKPSDPLAEYAFGEALMGTGDLPQAIASLEAAARLDPASLDYHMALATVYSRAGRYQDARRERRVSLDMAAK
jgi:tetratricopeptide (TPR) repeat protein